MKGRLFLGLGAGLLVPSFLACVVVACANDAAVNPSDAGQDASNVPDTPDGSSEASLPCDAGDSSSCNPPPFVPCEEADFCEEVGAIGNQASLTSIWGTGPSDVWVVGSRGTVVHFDGITWTPIPFDTNFTLRSVWASSTEGVWIAVGATFIYHSDGTLSPDGTTRWVQAAPCPVGSPTNGYPVLSLYGADGKVFANSYGYTYDNADALYASQARLWQLIDMSCANVGPHACDTNKYCGRGSPVTTPSMAIWGTSATDLWTLFGHRLFRSQANPDAGDTGDVSDAGDAGDAGVAGVVDLPGPLLWQEIDTQSNYDLYAVWGSAPSDVWMVGAGGRIRHSSGGSSADIVSSPTTQDLHGLWGTSRNDIWAVGDSGTVLHYDGSAWTPSTLSFSGGTVPNLYAVWGSGPDDLWIVGDGMVFRRHKRGDR